MENKVQMRGLPSRLPDVMEDLATRFIINSPADDLQSAVRLGFLLEEAYWYYIDFYRVATPSLPSMHFQEFSDIILRTTPMLLPCTKMLGQILGEFKSYKRGIPTCGVAMLNDKMTKVVLVSGGAKFRYSFPKGKRSKDETDESCALRETKEETGCDVSSMIQSDAYVENMIHGRRMRVFIVRGVSESTKFNPETRNEITDVKWFKVASLQQKRNVQPVLVKELVRWIAEHKNVYGKNGESSNNVSGSYSVSAADIEEALLRGMSD